LRALVAAAILMTMLLAMTLAVKFGGFALV
jgi:hypothetical protein